MILSKICHPYKVTHFLWRVDSREEGFEVIINYFGDDFVNHVT